MSLFWVKFRIFFIILGRKQTPCKLSTIIELSYSVNDEISSLLWKRKSDGLNTRFNLKLKAFETRKRFRVNKTQFSWKQLSEPQKYSIKTNLKFSKKHYAWFCQKIYVGAETVSRTNLSNGGDLCVGSGIGVFVDHIVTAHHNFVVANNNRPKRASFATINRFVSFFHCLCQVLLVSVLYNCVQNSMVMKQNQNLNA